MGEKAKGGVLKAQKMGLMMAPFSMVCTLENAERL